MYVDIMYDCMYVCMYVGLCMYVCMYMYVDIMYDCMYVGLCMYVCMYVCYQAFEIIPSYVQYNNSDLFIHNHWASNIKNQE